ncbi:MAG TPA: BTAD domain-containing putative transcriptional regulator [Caldilineaceae bacterium]|nr:BTAD domain-containing putative transcriptional regulator [Caldilineaceae bacterium]
MKTLQIFLLGQPRIVVTDPASPITCTRSVLALFAFLLLHPRRAIPREQIMDIFWGEHAEAQARSCLNSALWRLRNTLDHANCPAQEYLLSTEDGRVGFNWRSTYWLDVERFEQLSALLNIAPTALTPADAQQLETACRHYAGELLEGYYDDWALRERERLRRLYVSGLAHLMHYHMHQADLESALTFGRKILDLDPLREEIHRTLMRLYLKLGQRAKAIAQYEECRTLIADELGAEPMEETQLLYAEMLGLTATATGAGVPLPNLRDYQQTLRELKLAHKRIDEARVQIRRSIQLLEHCVEQIEMPR